MNFLAPFLVIGAVYIWVPKTNIQFIKNKTIDKNRVEFLKLRKDLSLLSIKSRSLVSNRNGKTQEFVWGRTPFYLDPDPVVVPEAIKDPEVLPLLSGIFYNANTPSALIQNSIREKGDSVEGGFIVKEINSETVLLERDGEAFELKLEFR